MDRGHAIIDISPFYETGDLETVDVTDYTQEYPEVIGLNPSPQTIQPSPLVRSTRAKEESPRISSRDPRRHRQLSIAPVYKLYGTATLRMADTTNVSQGLMETSADSDEENKLVINIQ